MFIALIIEHIPALLEKGDAEKCHIYLIIYDTPNPVFLPHPIPELRLRNKFEPKAFSRGLVGKLIGLLYIRITAKAQVCLII